MDNENIKEILEDNDELIVRYKDNSFECFDTLPKNVLDYITNLQEENERLKELCDKYEEEHNTEFKIWKDERHQLLDYKSRNENTINLIDRTIEIIKQQPTKDDSWILSRLYGFKFALNGGDEE